MGIEEMKTMKEQLMSCVQSQLGNLQNVDAKELGEAIDMIKDLSEAIYYCTITESMEKSSSEEKQVNNINYYTTNPVAKMYPDYYRDWERNNGYMYYPGGSSGSNSSGSSGSNSSGGSTNYYTESPMMMQEPSSMMKMRDPREGRSAVRRKMYMEGKEMHKDANSQLKEL